MAVAGDRVFMVTDNAHLIALNRSAGTLLWETEMADWQQNYYATTAPLIAGNLVSGRSSGRRRRRARIRRGVRRSLGQGSLAILDRAEARRAGFGDLEGQGHQIIPAEPPGSPALTTRHWTPSTGRRAIAGNDFNGDDRAGDNLYTDSDVALDAKTGKLKWYFQFTPHDVWDWDAVQTPVLVDANWQGQPRKLLLQANRNGFFYVLDRTSGKLLLAKPLVKKLTWASGIDSNGRPVLLPDQVPTVAGAKICPPIEGATNWFSTAFSPETGLYYVQTLEKCGIYTKSNL